MQCQSQGKRPILLKIKIKIIFNYLQDQSGRTPLVTAIHYGRVQAIIQMLASSGRIDWGNKARDGFNMLHLAVMKNDLKYVIYFF